MWGYALWYLLSVYIIREHERCPAPENRINWGVTLHCVRDRVNENHCIIDDPVSFPFASRSTYALLPQLPLVPLQSSFPRGVGHLTVARDNWWPVVVRSGLLSCGVGGVDRVSHEHFWKDAPGRKKKKRREGAKQDNNSTSHGPLTGTLAAFWARSLKSTRVRNFWSSHSLILISACPRLLFVIPPRAYIETRLHLPVHLQSPPSRL